MDPVVSCIVIFFNEEKFLPEAIESVFAQTFEDWELLLVDDGSSDRSGAIARDRAVKRPEKVRYLEHDGHQNRGMSAARNLGIRNARGKYVAFLDADDVWLPEKLERQVAILERNPATAMVYGCTEYWFSWTGDPAARGRDFVPRPPIPLDRIVEPPELLIGLLAEIPPAATCSILLRREALERVGGFEEAFRGLFEDQALLAKLYLRERVFVSGESVARYRMHPKSHVFVEFSQGRYPAARLVFLDWLEDHLLGSSVRDRGVWNALRAARRRYRHPIAWKMSGRGRRLLRRSRQLANLAGRAAGKLRRAALRRRGGTILARPNPIPLTDPFADRFPVGVTTLSWRADGSEIVEVRVGSPHGTLLTRAGASGSVTTGHWVTDGMTFYLQDVSGGRPLNSLNTLDTVEVAVRREGLDRARPSQPRHREAE